MKTVKVKIRNRAGIHCRPASMILNTINSEFPDSAFTVYSQEHETTEVNSILNLIALGLQCNDEVSLQVEGGDEDKAIERIGKLFEFEFDFPPNK